MVLRFLTLCEHRIISFDYYLPWVSQVQKNSYCISPSLTCRVIEHSATNRMQAQNMAIVFGPTLMWPAQESANMALTLVCQNQVVEILILDQARIFWGAPGLDWVGSGESATADFFVWILQTVDTYCLIWREWTQWVSCGTTVKKQSLAFWYVNVLLACSKKKSMFCVSLCKSEMKCVFTELSHMV